MARVLIVDDEQSIRVTLARFLANEDYTVKTAKSGPQAIEMLAGGAFDVVVSDIILPRMTGVELLQHIRANDPNIQVIVMTGEPTVETASEAVRAGAADYLYKPINKNAILRSVAHAARIKEAYDERTRLEAANRRYQEDLERLVNERTVELRRSNEELTSALAELKTTQRQVIQQERMGALGQMASGIAHDFNNALMPIIAFSDVLLTKSEQWPSSEEATRQLGMIKEAALDADRIVKRLRDFYRPRDGESFFTRVDLPEVIANTVAMTRPRWREESRAKGIDVDVTNNATAPLAVDGDHSELREALTNIILNAVDAMPDGGTITIGSAAAEGNEGNVCITVTDTGSGMDEETRRRCLDPLFSTKGERGTGMGLAVTYGIIRRHGGTIEIDSRPGQGATFRITLPASETTPAACVAPSPKTPATGLHVLVVDDDAGVREALTTYLTGDGHTTVVAASAAEGAQRFADGEFGLVIVDRAMPGGRGDELAAEVKRQAPDTPVILLTGFADMMGVTGDEPANVDLVLHKPATLDAVRAAIHQVTVR